MNENKIYETCATVMCEKRKALSVLRKIPAENLEQVIQMWLDLSADLVEKHKEEQRALLEKQEAAKKFIQEHNFSPEEAQQIFGSLFGMDTPTVKKPRAYHPPKYRITDANGKQVTWTGVGRRPKEFANLSEEELQQHAIK